MIETTSKIIDSGKKSLDTLLREKSYAEVAAVLKEKGIDINDVADEDVEALIAAKVTEKNNAIKGFATGTAFALLISAITGF